MWREILVLALVFITGQASAADIAIIPSTKTVTLGQTFYLNVSIDPDGTAISGAQLNIVFNKTILKVNSITEGDFFKQNGTGTFFNNGIINNSLGTVTNIFSVILGQFNVSTPGKFVIINATAMGSSGTSWVNLSNVIISDPEGNYVTLNVTNGSVVTNKPVIDYKIYIPWTATTGGWTTPYVIANKGSSNASVNIDYYNQVDGSYAGNYSVNILPGASELVFREWTTTSTDGSAVLVSDQPITVMIDQFNNGQNKFGAYEAEPSGSAEVSLPWTATTQGWTTPFVIVNRGTVNSTVNITYYYLNGSVAGSYSVDILPDASKFVFREWSAGGDGATSLSSTQPISAFVDIFNNAQNKFGAYTPAPIADNQIFIPWTATTQGWTTQFKIVNRGSGSAIVNISYYNQANGLLAGTDSVSIAPNAVTTVSREISAANGTDGSAVLNSTQPISVIVQQLNNKEGKFEVYTPSMTASNTIVVPWTATTQGWTTPYVIVNKGNASANVNINYHNQAGNSITGTYSVNILPGASKFVFREWTISNTDGSAVLISDQPISVVVDQFNNEQNKFGVYTPTG